MSVFLLRSATVLRIAVLAIGALGLQVVAAQPADASCGNWLAGHEAETVTVDAFEASATQASPMANLRDLANAFGTDSSDADPPNSRPCDGPGCRQLPTMPDAPLAPSTTRLIAPDWLLKTSLTGLLGLPAIGRVWVDRDAVLLPAEQGRIERPPRSC